MQLSGIVIGFAAICGGIYFLSDMELKLPKTLGPVSQMNRLDGQPAGQPSVWSDFLGHSYRDGATLTASNDAPGFATLVANLDPARDSILPSGIEKADIPKNCQPERPSRDAVLANVNLEESNRDGPLHFLHRAAFAKAAVDLIRYHKAHDYRITKPGTSDIAGKETAGYVDVLVTETARPVYLVLQTKGSALWNVTAAPGVRIERIVVLAGQTGAVAVQDENVPLTVIGDMHANCGTWPARPLDPTWQVMTNEAENGVEFNHAKFDGPAADYAAWFKKKFGSPASEGRLMALEAGYVLVGPQPTVGSLPQWRSPAGRKVLYSGGEAEPVLATTEAFDTKVGEMQVSLVDQAIGAPFESLKPVVEEKTQ